MIFIVTMKKAITTAVTWYGALNFMLPHGDCCGGCLGDVVDIRRLVVVSCEIFDDPTVARNKDAVVRLDGESIAG